MTGLNIDSKGTRFYKYSNGDVYIGSFMEDHKEGKGVMFFGNGDIFQGEWAQDEISGKGILYKSDGMMIESDY